MINIVGNEEYRHMNFFRINFCMSIKDFFFFYKLADEMYVNLMFRFLTLDIFYSSGKLLRAAAAQV